MRAARRINGMRILDNKYWNLGEDFLKWKDGFVCSWISCYWWVIIYLYNPPAAALLPYDYSCASPAEFSLQWWNDKIIPLIQTAGFIWNWGCTLRFFWKLEFNQLKPPREINLQLQSFLFHRKLYFYPSFTQTLILLATDVFMRTWCHPLQPAFVLLLMLFDWCQLIILVIILTWAQRFSLAVKSSVLYWNWKATWFLLLSPSSFILFTLENRKEMVIRPWADRSHVSWRMAFFPSVNLTLSCLVLLMAGWLQLKGMIFWFS